MRDAQRTDCTGGGWAECTRIDRFWVVGMLVLGGWIGGVLVMNSWIGLE